MVLTNENFSLLGLFSVAALTCERTVLSKGEAGFDVCPWLSSEESFVCLFP